LSLHDLALLPSHAGCDHSTLNPGNAVELVNAVNGNRQDLALDLACPLGFLLFVLDTKLNLLFQRILFGSVVEQQRYGFVFLSGLGLPRRDRFILAEQLDSQLLR
jgi:hypothetical protein